MLCGEKEKEDSKKDQRLGGRWASVGGLVKSLSINGVWRSVLKICFKGLNQPALESWLAVAIRSGLSHSCQRQSSCRSSRGECCSDQCLGQRWFWSGCFLKLLFDVSQMAEEKFQRGGVGAQSPAGRHVLLHVLLDLPLWTSSVQKDDQESYLAEQGDLMTGKLPPVQFQADEMHQHLDVH